MYVYSRGRSPACDEPDFENFMTTGRTGFYTKLSTKTVVLGKGDGRCEFPLVGYARKKTREKRNT
jgi:hypothetical protein